jgi:hypothetical protein
MSTKRPREIGVWNAACELALLETGARPPVGGMHSELNMWSLIRRIRRLSGAAVSADELLHRLSRYYKLDKWAERVDEATAENRLLQTGSTFSIPTELPEWFMAVHVEGDSEDEEEEEEREVAEVGEEEEEADEEEEEADTSSRSVTPPPVVKTPAKPKHKKVAKAAKAMPSPAFLKCDLCGKIVRHAGALGNHRGSAACNKIRREQKKGRRSKRRKTTKDAAGDEEEKSTSDKDSPEEEEAEEDDVVMEDAEVEGADGSSEETVGRRRGRRGSQA